VVLIEAVPVVLIEAVLVVFLGVLSVSRSVCVSLSPFGVSVCLCLFDRGLRGDAGIPVCVCMSVYMYVCMRVRVCVCQRVYACMFACVYCMYVNRCVRMFVCMYVCMCECMYVCRYVCMC